MIRKKIAVFVALLSVASMAIAGCGSTAGNSTGQESKTTEATQAQTQNVAQDSKYIDNLKSKGKLVVGCKADVPGLGYYESDTDSWSGLEVELAYKTAGILFDVTPEEAREKDMVEIKAVTVADREEMLENGDIDCMLATYTITDERQEKYALSESYYTDYIGLMVRDSGASKDNNSLGSNDIHSIADLDGKYIGVPRNATTREHFLNYIDTMNTIKVNPIFCEYESYSQLFKALKDGNIDVMSVDVSILSGYVDSSTKILNDRFAGQHYGAAVLKKNAALLEYVNKAIE
ncbi:MAG: transporter substrate-binding domain-containing protein [Eubacteriales bacterium]|nr:transporter substrate-binding domain-containing protein [Eubacteriales bacterium]